MESAGGHRSGGGSVGAVPGTGAGAEGGAGGLLCHACGYQYPNAHPSAKQRRAHRKHCGKSPASPTAVAAEDEEQGVGGGGTGEQPPEGRVLFPGEGGETRVGGDGTAASAAGRGGGSPGSAQEDADKTEPSSHDDAGAQVIVEKCVEDRSDVASGITLPETRSDNSGALNDVATGYSGKASLPEEGVPSVPASAVGSVQLQDVSVPVLQSEPEYGVGVGPELSSVSEMQNSNPVALASDATEGEISEQTNDVLAEPNGTTVTGVDGTVNAIGKDTLSEEKSIKGGDLDPSCQENRQAEVGVGQNNTAVEEDSSDKILSAVQIEDIPNDKPESTNQSGSMLTSPDPIIEEPAESGTQETVGADDFHSEATETVKPREQPDSTSVGEDHLDVPKQIDIFEGEHHPNEDGGPQTISSAVGPVVNAEVISVGDADNMTKNVHSSDVTMADRIQDDVNSNSVVPSQADIVDLTKSTTISEINTVNSTNDVEEKGQNEKSVANENELQIKELVAEKQQDKEIVADSISHSTNAVCSTVNHGVNEKETITETSSCNIPSTRSIEEEKQIEEFIANLAPENTNVTSNREDVEENKQIEDDVKTDRAISVVGTIEAIEEKDTTSELNAENIADNVEDKKQSEEISAGDISDGTSMKCSTVSEEKMHTDNKPEEEDPSSHEKAVVPEDPSSHEKTVVHNIRNNEEKNNEETMVDPTSHSIGILTAIDSVEEMKNDQTPADLTSHGINAPHATEEKKDGEPVEENQNEETAVDQISGENSTQQSTDAAENGTLNKDGAAVLVSDKSEAAEKTDAVEGTEEKNEITAKEISTVQSTDDPKGAGQNEEIADKEVIVDSDRSHVSLKVLLADKNVETKEKKPSTKDRVLSFRRRASKDNESPMKPGSPKAGSAQQDWNSPARLPAEKKPKGKKQQWVPFICCPSIH